MQDGVPFVEGQQWTNWAGNQTASPQRIFSPRSVAELQEVVGLARQQGKRIRVVGQGHSWSPLVLTNDYLVRTRELRRIEVDPERKQVSIEAGATMAELSQAIRARGLYLSTTTVTDRVSIGGAVATGVHGTGLASQTLSDAVVALDLVLASGEVRTFTEERDGAEVMNAVRVSLGVLGIITRVTFQLVDMFNLHAVDEKRDMAETIARVKELVTGNDHVEIFWWPFNRKVWIKKWNRTQNRAERVMPAYWRSGRETMELATGARLLDLLMVAPRLTPSIDRLMFRLVKMGERVVPAPIVFHYQSSAMKVIDTGCSIPIDPDFEVVKTAWHQVVRRVEECAAAGKFPQNMPLHMRFIKDSSALLSSATGNTATCSIEILTRHHTPGYEEYFRDTYRGWAALGGRPHWGKLFYDLADVRLAFGERLHAFDRIRQELDPTSMFLNAPLKELLVRA